MWSSRAHRELGEVLDFLRLLWAIEHELKSTSKYMQKRLGITGPQRLVLRIVGRFPDISAGEVAEILHLHPSTLTGVIERLADRGLLIKERDHDDARRLRLKAAPRGRSGTPPVTVEAAVERAFRQVKPLEIKHACRVLDAVLRSLAAHASDQAALRARRIPAQRALRRA